MNAKATFGLSLWMPTTAILSDRSGAGVALSDVTAAVILVSALVLWNSRQRIPALQGLMWLLAAGCVSTAAFLFGAHALGLNVRSSWPGGSMVSPLHHAWMLGLFPAIAVWMLMRHPSGEQRASQCLSGGPAAGSRATRRESSVNIFSKAAPPLVKVGLVIAAVFIPLAAWLARALIDGARHSHDLTGFIAGIALLMADLCVMLYFTWQAIQHRREQLGLLPNA